MSLIGAAEIASIQFQPQVQPEQKLAEINNGSSGSIRQSYDNSSKNISLGTLNTIASKKSMRSQHRRRRKSREDSMNEPGRRKRKDSRLFKKSFGGPAIKLNLNQTGLSLNQNILKH